MTTRVFNFGAGPAVLPMTVLEQMREDLLALPGVGMSVLEISHRSSSFDEVLATAEANIRSLASMPDDYQVLFMQGGATHQFAMVPMNLFLKSRPADYVVTGSWAQKAAKEAEKFGVVRVAASTETEGFRRVPTAQEIDLDSTSSYVHLTSNNTIFGTEWGLLPDTGDVPLVVDASSNILSRPIEVVRHGLIYAGAQKNLGPAGVTLVIVRPDLLERAPASLPTMMRYGTFADSGSLHNTPPVFAIYALSLVTSWLLGQGGLVAIEEKNKRKAGKLYTQIDSSDFYRGTALPNSRSRMNITFRLPSTELDDRFVAEAANAGFAGLKGHRSVGGQRASIYNAFPEEGVDALVSFMAEFERTNG
ncbi:MAG: 3-phosphoserine/phosphohydroxythreonine transaminase [Vicinamibacterales bacterium]